MIDYSTWLLLGLIFYLLIRITFLSNKVNLMLEWIAETDKWLEEDSEYIVLDIDLDKEEK